MRLQLFQVDAFTDRVFAGNPAAVVLLEEPIEDEVLQSIAAENNLSETAFIYPPEGGSHRLRWFTPCAEVDLCGHATLASAHVLFSTGLEKSRRVEFKTQSGALTVENRDGWLSMDFPSRPPVQVDFGPELAVALGAMPLEAHASRDLLVLFETEQSIASLCPDFSRIAKLDTFGVIATAKGSDVDFVSRWFGPKVGVPEDPVTGSAHCTLAPFWSARLGKSVLRARQISQRGGELLCEVKGDRVLIKGHAVEFFRGEIFLP